MNEWFDEEPDDNLTMMTSVSGHARAHVSVTSNLTTGPATVSHIRPLDEKPTAYVLDCEPIRVRLVKPPKFIWGWLDGTLMSPKRYRQLCGPHIADMREQYYECISSGDESGARWAVIRANLYAMPIWAWGAVGSLLSWVKHMVSP